MEAYSEFAQVYDLFMDNIPYEEWCSYLETLLKKYGVEDGLVLDMGCGTGNITEALRRRGYDMIGIDNSCLLYTSLWIWSLPTVISRFTGWSPRTMDAV